MLLSIHMQCVQVGWIEVRKVIYLTICPNRALEESYFSKFGKIKSLFYVKVSSAHAFINGLGKGAKKTTKMETFSKRGGGGQPQILHF